MRRYDALHDPVSNEDNAYYSGKIMAKFCSMGFVTSSKWFPAYITIIDGRLRLYADENAVTQAPNDFIQQVSLTRDHRSSAIKKKNYSKDNSMLIEFYCFYVEIDNGVLSPIRQLKIGCLTQQAAQQIVDAIEVNTKGDSI